MHCDAMICTYNKGTTHCDVTLDVHSNIISHCDFRKASLAIVLLTHCDVIMSGHCDVTLDVPSNIITHCDFTKASLAIVLLTHCDVIMSGHCDVILIDLHWHDWSPFGELYTCISHTNQAIAWHNMQLLTCWFHRYALLFVPLAKLSGRQLTALFCEPFLSLLINITSKCKNNWYSPVVTFINRDRTYK